jgi:hypothetical protein
MRTDDVVIDYEVTLKKVVRGEKTKSFTKKIVVGGQKIDSIINKAPFVITNSELCQSYEMWFNDPTLYPYQPDIDFISTVLYFDKQEMMYLDALSNELKSLINGFFQDAHIIQEDDVKILVENALTGDCVFEKESKGYEAFEILQKYLQNDLYNQILETAQTETASQIELMMNHLGMSYSARGKLHNSAVVEVW